LSGLLIEALGRAVSADIIWLTWISQNSAEGIAKRSHILLLIRDDWSAINITNSGIRRISTTISSCYAVMHCSISIILLVIESILNTERNTRNRFSPIVANIGIAIGASLKLADTSSKADWHKECIRTTYAIPFRETFSDLIVVTNPGLEEVDA